MIASLRALLVLQSLRSLACAPLGSNPDTFFTLQQEMSNQWIDISLAYFLLTGVKLGMHSIPIATACTIYHKFFCEINVDAYDPYLVAMSSLYLAGKVEEQHLRTRDIINVSNR